MRIRQRIAAREPISLSLSLSLVFLLMFLESYHYYNMLNTLLRSHITRQVPGWSCLYIYGWLRTSHVEVVGYTHYKIIEENTKKGKELSCHSSLELILYCWSFTSPCVELVGFTQWKIIKRVHIKGMKLSFVIYCTMISLYHLILIHYFHSIFMTIYKTLGLMHDFILFVSNTFLLIMSVYFRNIQLKNLK